MWMQRSRLPARQRGSIILPAAAALIVCLILLGSANLGYLFYVKRELQNAADLAALSGVQYVRDDMDCTASQLHARAAINDFLIGKKIIDLDFQRDVTVECGEWSPSNYAAPEFFGPGQVGVDGFFNSVKITIAKGSIFPLMPFSEVGNISVAAVAKSSDPVAAFSVGSRLLSVDKNGLLGVLLKGVGLNPEVLTVLDSNGVANLKVTPSGLLKALGLPPTVLLGVGTPDELARLEQLKLGDLLNAMLAVVEKDNTLVLGVGALRDFVTLTANLDIVKQPIKLIRFPDELGNLSALLELGHGDDLTSALHAQLNVLNLLTSSIAIANGSNLLDLSLGGDGSPLGNFLKVKARIVEPPSIAIGGIGTKANSAAVRVYVRISTTEIPIVGRLLAAVVKLDVPLILEVAQSDGVLVGVCEPKQNQARIDVTSSLINVCLGRFPKSGDFFSLENSCKYESFTQVERHEIFNLLGLLPLTARVTLPLGESKTQQVILTAPSSQLLDGEYSKMTVRSTGLDLAQTIQAVSDAVIGGLLGDLLGDHNVSNASDEVRKGIAEELVGRNGAGRAVSDVFAEMKWSKEYMERLGERMGSNGLTGALGGTLTFVGNLLGTILVAPLADLGCSVAILGGVESVRKCRVSAVKDLALSGSGLLGGLASVLIDLLRPILDLLSYAVNGLLQVLGISLGETDVELLDVQCGAPVLVY
ncbi:pilus assembly protein TadG-related protein [Kerstersia similis]|uniref:pilus assembly protein TadG-related protein n=1 Tax=Kerstersia similis TaxID=206505 RepID=UPI0039EEAC7A